MKLIFSSIAVVSTLAWCVIDPTLSSNFALTIVASLWLTIYVPVPPRHASTVAAHRPQG